MLDRYIRDVGETNGYHYLFEKITPTLRKSDVVIANLEGTVSTFTSKSSGTKPGEKFNTTFTFSPEAISPFLENKIHIVSLGNNHAYDFGKEGLAQTKAFLNDSEIDLFGEPFNNDSYLTKTIDGLEVALIAFNEFAGGSVSGTLENIKKFKNNDAFVIVYAHWGEEYKKEPNETQRELAHRFVDEGADIVIGSHPHVVQEKEVYNGKVIYYSLGNFIFDQYFDEEVRCGALVSITIPGNAGGYDIEEEFVYLEKTGQTVPSTCLSVIPFI